MSNFKDQIEDLSGTIDVDCDAEQFIKDGVKDIIHRIRRIDKDKLHQFTGVETVTTMATSFTDEAIFNVSRLNALGADGGDGKYYSADEVPIQISDSLIDADSEHYASPYNPKYYFVNGKIFIVPAPSANSTASIAKIIYAVPTTWESTDTLTGAFPEGLKYLLVIYAALMVIHNKIVNVYLGMPSAIELPTIVPAPILIEVSEALPTYVSPSAFIISSPPDFREIDYDIEIENPPVWTPPLMGDIPTIDISDTLTIEPLDNSITLPLPPALPSFSDGSIDFTKPREKAPEFNAPTEIWQFDSIDAEIVNANNLISLSQAEVEQARDELDLTEDLYKEAKAVLDVVTGTYSDGTYSDNGLITDYRKYLDGDGVDLVSVADLLETAHDRIHHDDITHETDGYFALCKEAVSELKDLITSGEENVDSSEAYINSLMGRADEDAVNPFNWVGSSDGEETGDANKSGLGEILEQMKNYFDENENGNIIGYIQTQEDVEMAGALNAALGTLIQTSQAYMGKVSTELAGIKEFTVTGQSYIAIAQSKAAECQAAISAVQGHLIHSKGIMDEVQGRVAVFQGHLVDIEARYKNVEQILNQIRTRGEIAAAYMAVGQGYIGHAAAYNQTAQNKLAKENARTQKFSATVQSAVQSFNNEVAIYQAEIKKSSDDVAGKLKSEQVEATSLIQLHSSEVNKYQIQVNQIITEWQQGVVNKSIEEFKTNKGSKISKYTVDVDKAMKEYQAKLSGATASYKSDFDKWASSIQRKLQSYQAETGYDLSRYQYKTQADIELFKTNLTKSVQFFEAGIKRFQSNLAKVGETNQARIGVFNADVQAYQIVSNTAIQNYGQELQKNTQKAQTLAAQYATLLQRYMEAFQQAKMDVAEEQQQQQRR